MGEIRQSPYEKGLYFVGAEPGTTLQSIGMTEWKVGERYTLNKVLGYGSMSCVCLATDNTTGEKVALKRIGDVLHSPDTAKRVLREVGILRRVNHPNVIGIKDCFVRPSATGQCRMINGKLVNISLDLYIAMEFADGGDLFHMRGQLSEEEVKSLTWQLLQALNYLHSMDVWHRDVKSQNAFISLENGLRVVKLGDLGSARSGYQRRRRPPTPFMTDTADTMQPQARADSIALKGPNPLPPSEAAAAFSAQQQQQQQQQQHQVDDEDMNQFLPPIHPDQSLLDMQIEEGDLYAQINQNDDDFPIDSNAAVNPSTSTTQTTNNTNPSTKFVYKGGKGGGFKPPLTRVVATPCYRAPEVVMSRGGYTAAIDTWGVGCIFGELLQRVAYVGSASTPNLHVAPMFAIKGMFKTPNGEESFGKPESLITRRELEALFDVVGTPSWRDAAAVEIVEWRRYLEKLPGRAPSLYRRFSSAGEPAIHLLSRLLEFDPKRRMLTEEALCHEYFRDLRTELELLALEGDAVGNSQQGFLLDIVPSSGVQTAGGAQVYINKSTSEMEIDDSSGGLLPGGGSMNKKTKTLLERQQQHSSSIVHVIPPEVISAGVLPQHQMDTVGIMAIPLSAAPSRELTPQPSTTSTQNFQHGGGGIGGGDNQTTTTNVGQHQPPNTTTTNTTTALQSKSPTKRASLRYWEEQRPGRALALLEEALAVCTSPSNAQEYAPASEGYNILRDMLERECEAIAMSHGGSGSVGDTVISVKTTTTVQNQTQHLRQQQKTAATSLSSMLKREGLVPDEGAGMSLSSDPGKNRLSNVADTMQGKELDLSKILGPKRHGEWTSNSGTEPASVYQYNKSIGTSTWGVSSMPPGVDDPKIAEIIKKQQTR